jgi:hypothetical protein
LWTILVAPVKSAERVVLKGEDYMAVGVDLAAALQSDGVQSEQIMTDIQLRLRQAGVRVVDQEIGPHLYVSIDAVKSGNGIYAYEVIARFTTLVVRASDFSELLSVSAPVPPELPPISRAAVWRLRNSAVIATVWDQSIVGIAGAVRIRETIRDSVRDVVDRFLNDWLAVNPRK